MMTNEFYSSFIVSTKNTGTSGAFVAAKIEKDIRHTSRLARCMSTRSDFCVLFLLMSDFLE